MLSLQYVFNLYFERIFFQFKCITETFNRNTIKLHKNAQFGTNESEIGQFIRKLLQLEILKKPLQQRRTASRWRQSFNRKLKSKLKRIQTRCRVIRDTFRGSMITVKNFVNGGGLVLRAPDKPLSLQKSWRRHIQYFKTKPHQYPRCLHPVKSTNIFTNNMYFF